MNPEHHLADGASHQQRPSYDPERFRFVAPKVIDPAEFEGLTASQITTRANQEIESLIRMAPEQYLWLHDRFRDRPVSEPITQPALP